MQCELTLFVAASRLMACQHQLGVTFYPSHYWAIGVPCWVCVSYGQCNWRQTLLNRVLLYHINAHPSMLNDCLVRMDLRQSTFAAQCRSDVWGIAAPWCQRGLHLQ